MFRQLKALSGPSSDWNKPGWRLLNTGIRCMTRRRFSSGRRSSTGPGSASESVQPAKSNSAGRRALAVGGPVDGRPRQSRIFRITGRSVTNASTLICPPQRTHRSTSVRQTRLNSSAQGRRVAPSPCRSGLHPAGRETLAPRAAGRPPAAARPPLASLNSVRTRCGSEPDAGVEAAPARPACATVP